MSRVRNSSGVRVQNRGDVLRYLARHPGVPRRDIADALGLTRATITNITRELIDAGLVSHTSDANGDPQKNGRSLPLEVSANGAYFLGLNLGTTGMAAGLVDLRGNLCTHKSMPYRTLEPEQVVSHASRLVEHIIHMANVPPERLNKAVGVGIPGAVDHSHGIVESHLGLSWQDVALAPMLSESLGMPVRLANNVHGMATFEWLYGSASGIDDFVLLFVSTHIGAGIYHRGRMLEGAHGLAGRLAHVQIDPTGPVCRCGRRGCLQALAGDLAVIDSALRALASGRSSSLQDPRSRGTIRITHLYEAARNGDSLASELLRQQARYIGQAISDLLYTVDPRRVILLSPAVAPDIDLGKVDFFGTVLATVEHECQLIPDAAERVVHSNLGFHSTVFGSVASCMAEFFDTVPILEN